MVFLSEESKQQKSVYDVLCNIQTHSHSMTQDIISALGDEMGFFFFFLHNLLAFSNFSLGTWIHFLIIKTGIFFLTECI